MRERECRSEDRSGAYNRIDLFFGKRRDCGSRRGQNTYRFLDYETAFAPWLGLQPTQPRKC